MTQPYPSIPQQQYHNDRAEQVEDLKNRCQHQYQQPVGWRQTVVCTRCQAWHYRNFP